MKTLKMGMFAAALLASAGAASADDLIIPVGAPSNASSVTPTQYNQVSFTLPSAYVNVDIDASLVTSSTALQSGTAYLTNMVGAGTTAANVIAETPFNFVNVGNASTELGWVDLFSGLNLGAGTYYVVFSSTTSASSFISLSPNMTFTTAPGVTVGQMQFAAGTNIDPTFAPASTFATSGLGNRFFRVTGEIPAPGSVALLGLGGLLAARRRR